MLSLSPSITIWRSAHRYGFTGRERDDFTGLLHYRARQYSAELGRFISEDPIGFAGKDLNLYGYVKNAPMTFIDPSGLDRFPPQNFYREQDEKWKKYQENQKQIYEAGFHPQNFQCGPSPFTLMSHLVRDRVGGPGLFDGYAGSMYNFKPACYEHDVCYGTCGKTQLECDLQFHKHLNWECDRTNDNLDWGRRLQCKRLADWYFWGVSNLGESAFDESQTYNKCDKCKAQN